MVDEEKKIPDPIDIDGIQIGEDRFRIKSNLDLNRRENSIIGLNSVARSPEKEVIAADGQNPQDATAIASGIGSYALGPGAIAQGHYSFAVGSGANAVGNDSFCHAAFGVYGNNPTASLINHYPYGRALGEGSVSFNRGGALADYSFAEGRGITGKRTSQGYDPTVGKYSHAEGRGEALEDYSHAEGISRASGKYSHAEGYSYAFGNNSHAEGGLYGGSTNDMTRAKGVASHAEGIGTYADGYCSHAEGYYSVANGFYCHAGGSFTKAGGTKEDFDGSNTNRANCIAIGENTISSGFNSIASGDFTRAAYPNSAVFGGATVAKDNEQFVIGRANVPTENKAFIIGGGKCKGSPWEEDQKKGRWTSPDNPQAPDFHLIQKNILEFDWDGNLWISGSFSYGEDNKPIDFNNYYTKIESDEKFSTKEEIKNKLLPSVSTSDNGKILMVENGAWTATTIVNSEEVAY